MAAAARASSPSTAWRSITTPARDSIQNVLDRINNSSAGVTATYDTLNNRFTLTNNSTGDVGISMQDVTGNFLAATGLSSGTLTRGQNLLYTLNGGSQTLVSQSNTITQASSGITGLSVTAASTGSTTVTVSSDTSKISSAIQQFITDYNAVQTAISSQQTCDHIFDRHGDARPADRRPDRQRHRREFALLEFFRRVGIVQFDHVHR